jgi:hypothetical protein
MSVTCPNCHSEWNKPDGKIKAISNCPLCKNPLPEPVTADMAEVVRQIVKMRGPQIIQEKAFANLISDLDPMFGFERRWINSAATRLKLGKLFYEAHMSNDYEKQSEARAVGIARLKEDGASELKANFVVDCFSYGIGFDETEMLEDSINRDEKLKNDILRMAKLKSLNETAPKLADMVRGTNLFLDLDRFLLLVSHAYFYGTGVPKDLIEAAICCSDKPDGLYVLQRMRPSSRLWQGAQMVS